MHANEFLLPAGIHSLECNVDAGQKLTSREIQSYELK